jgi:hypothetical protein
MEYITKIPAASSATIKKQPLVIDSVKTRQQTGLTTKALATASTIEAQPKYKCCKCCLND